MAKQNSTGLLVNGSVKAAGMTFYTRQGQTVVRSAHSVQPERRSRGQFDQRMRMRHTIALWHVFKASGPLFGEGVAAYRRFASAANHLTPVYVPCNGPLGGATFLLPGMRVSDGVLPVVEQWLGEVDGTPALLTSLSVTDLQRGDLLRFYTVQQRTDSYGPVVRIKSDELSLSDFREVDGHLALVSDDFADDMKGWALVHVRPKRKQGGQTEYRCSSQTVVTRCTYYLPFTTEEALQTAAQTYGGLTEEVHP